MAQNKVDEFVRAVCARQPRGHYFDFNSHNPAAKRPDKWNYCVRCGVLLHERDGELYECQDYYVIYRDGRLIDVTQKPLTSSSNKTIVSALGS